MASVVQAGAWVSFAASSAAQMQHWMASPAAPQSLEAGFLSALDAVAAHGLAAVAALDLLQRAEAELQKVHVPRFWAGLQQAQPPETGDGDGREDGADDSELEEGLLNSLKASPVIATSLSLFLWWW